MKSARLLISVVIAGSLLVSQAFAQTGTMRVAVPFNFSVGNQSLAAGDYRMTIKFFPPALLMDRMDGSGSASALPNYTTARLNRDELAKLVFHCYASHCFLSEASMRGVGYELPASAAELEYAQKIPQDRAVLAARTDRK